MLSVLKVQSCEMMAYCEICVTLQMNVMMALICFPAEETDNNEGETPLIQKAVKPVGPPVATAQSKLTVFQVYILHVIEISYMYMYIVSRIKMSNFIVPCF